MKKGEDTPGNAMMSALEYQRQMIRSQEQLIRCDRILERLFDDDVEVLGMSIRLPQEDAGDYLVTVRARKGNNKVVAFHAANTLAEVLRGVLAKLENRSIRWKEDNYAR